MNYVKKAVSIALITIEVCLGLYSGYMVWSGDGLWVLWMASTFVFFREAAEDVEKY